MKKIADLFKAKDKHGRDYLISRYEKNIVYYIFKNEYQNTNNADYFLYAKKVFVKKRRHKRGRGYRSLKGGIDV